MYAHHLSFLCALIVLAAGCRDRATDEGRPPLPQDSSARSLPSTPPPGTSTGRSSLPHHGGAADAPANPHAAKVSGHAVSRVRENLDRGLTAVAVGEGRVYLSWRLLDSDPPNVAFDVHRIQDNADAGSINDRPLAQTTDFLDHSVPPDVKQLAYYIVPVGGDAEGRPSKTAEVNLKHVWPGYFSIPLDGNYSANNIALADLTGDGRLEMIIRRPDKSHGPGAPWKLSTDTYKIEAYTQDGTRLWQHDMGWSIELGNVYSPFVAYDFDGDGRAEVAVKYNPGDHRDMEKRPGPDAGEGRVRSGPEFLAVFDGASGEMKAETDWPGREEWTPDLVVPEGIARPAFPYRQYEARNQMGVAYLDGRTPCIIVARGVYHLIVVEAFEYRSEGSLRKLWHWDNRGLPYKYWGQAGHNMVCVDLDGDGRDEVLLGSLALDDDGSVLWTTGLGHSDAAYVGDLDPAREGLEVYFNIENRPHNLDQLNTMCMVDAATGRLIWGYDRPTRHVHGWGLCSDIDPDHPGAECYGGEKFDRNVRWLWNSKGELLATEDLDNFTPRAVYWDETPQREIIIGAKKGIREGVNRSQEYEYSNHHVRKYKGPILSPEIEGEILAVADILGDWREEIVTVKDSELRIYFTTIPAAFRKTCLLQDPFYRSNVASLSGGYNYVPTLSYDMAASVEGLALHADR